MPIPRYRSPKCGPASLRLRYARPERGARNPYPPYGVCAASFGRSPMALAVLRSATTREVWRRVGLSGLPQSSSARWWSSSRRSSSSYWQRASFGRGVPHTIRLLALVPWLRLCGFLPLILVLRFRCREGHILCLVVRLTSGLVSRWLCGGWVVRMSLLLWNCGETVGGGTAALNASGVAPLVPLFAPCLSH